MTLVLSGHHLIWPIEEGKALLVVNNKVTYHRQSWIPKAPGMQAVFIPTTSDENCPVPAIIKEHKLYFHLHIISLMFTWHPEDCTTWDVH